MNGDELFALAEEARKKAMAKAMSDSRVWRDQIYLLLTGLLKFMSIQMGLMFLLVGGGIPEPEALPVVFLTSTLLAFFNPGHFFFRSLFTEIGDDAFNEVIEKHKPNR